MAPVIMTQILTTYVKNGPGQNGPSIKLHLMSKYPFLLLSTNLNANSDVYS